MADSPEQRGPDVLVLGGGLAGIAAAFGLQRHGCRVTLVEARPRLGGRATSYVDQESGLLIDNCQHVSMGCCTNLTHLCHALGIGDLFTDEPRLFFVAPDGRVTPFAAGRWPAPLHLTRSFLRLPYLTFREKRLFASAVRALARARPESLSGVCFEIWLRKQRQTEALIRNVWEVVLVSALSESLDRIDARYARKVFVDGFLANTSGWRVRIPSVPLDELYSGRTRRSLEEAGIDVRCGARVASLDLRDDAVASVLLNEGTKLTAEDFILAVPHHQVAALLPEPLRDTETVRRLERIESAPIASVHLWFDRPITDLPHAVFVGKLCQWVFDRGRAAGAEKRDGEEGAGGSAGASLSDGASLYQVVISASRDLQGVPQAEVIDRVQEELHAAWPKARTARLLHARLITERRAVFSVTPGIDDLRPPQQSPVGNLQFAGDWTRTDWPATMEGAVRSGYLAAENILRRHGREVRLVQPGLPVAPLARWLLGIR